MSILNFDEIQGVCSAASGADFSADSVYRYALWRVWDSVSKAGNVAIFGVNPSTADELENDMTITKSVGFAKRWGYGGMYMLNPYAYVATNRAQMVAAIDPIGPRNDASIAEYLANCNIRRVVVAWGSLPRRWQQCIGWEQRIEAILRIINRPVYCLGRTADGSPRHPSRIPYDTRVELFC